MKEFPTGAAGDPSLDVQAMKMRSGILSSLAAALLIAGCSSSTQPSGTASVTAPAGGVTPVPNSTVRYSDQPITLSVANAMVTQPSGTTYTFEVSSDSNFSTKVQTKADVAEGANGATSVRLDQLAGGADYYWHARTTSGGTVGVFGPTYKFTVGPPIVINAATAVSPAGGASTGSMPTFVVANAQKTGPAGQLTYRFEVSTTPTFATLAAQASVTEGNSGRTTWVSQVELPAETTLYWRVTAVDQANNVSSPVSSTASFVTSMTIDLNKVVYLNSPNIASWPRIGFVELVEQDGGGDGPMCIKFTDPGWPDSPWPYGGPGDDPNFGVFANQWYFAKIGGVWYGGAGEWIYRSAPSICKSGQGTETIGPDSGFGEPFASWRPRVGELVGYAVTSVARRGSVRRTVDQRTQVVVQPWRDTTRGSTLGAPTLSLAAPGSTR
jgi:hypothetical protein